jgi:antitoxin MazE
MKLASMEKTSRTIELKVVPIGNSRGVRLPKAVLDKYAIKGELVLEERQEGLLLRNKGDKRLSWEDTFKQMAKEREDWSDLDATMADGLNQESKW